MTALTATLLFILTFAALSYHRVRLLFSTITLFAVLVVLTRIAGMSVGLTLCWLVFLPVAAFLNYSPWRRQYASNHLYRFFKNEMPVMSRTEREAINAGTVTWEGDIFRGNPDWKKLLDIPPATLTEEEQAFIENQVNTLCSMLDDWDITYQADLPKAVWAYMKEQGFFGLIIPKQYGGKGFSQYAHGQVITKISGRSITASTTVSVPNSLGPAELLVEYGTTDQKNYYLPRLASGEEIPCFALTSPSAGSDASAMTDNGIVCYDLYQGNKTLGIRLNWNKRYITLAPIATVIGLAFKLYDPDHLLGSKTDIGITCALIPSNLPGITIGRRHYPVHTPFQHGPIQGNNVFIPLDFIIGGREQAGFGWRMLMECLAGGRAITLPSTATGCAKVAAFATGAYARIRRQFKQPIGFFEGIEEPIARISCYTYIMDAARTLVSGSLSQGEKPAVASAIVKYHVTELGRMVSDDAMDVHGGKGICLGPNNYLGQSYESGPIAITVEGANILTRNLIIFGQGAMRCHPYVYKEIQAVQLDDEKKGMLEFDKIIFQHIGFSISNVVRAFTLAITGARFTAAPSGKLKRYFQYGTRFSSAFALMADASMLMLGGSLKRKETLSARLGDILSYLYLLSAVLKQYHTQGKQIDDLPLVRYSAEYCLYKAQDRFDELLQNFPNRPVAWLLRVLMFPFGRHFKKPIDHYHHKIAQLFIAPTPTRQRLAQDIYLAPQGHNCMADVQDALVKTILAEPIEKIMRDPANRKQIQGYDYSERAQSAFDLKIITLEQFDILMAAEAARCKVIAVDDFAPEALTRHPTQRANENKIQH